MLASTTRDTHQGERFPLLLSAAFVASSTTAFLELNQLILPQQLAGAGHYQFLTNIALCFSTLYFAVNLVYHITGFTFLQPVKVYLSAICLPLNFVVSIVYWSLRLLLPYLIITDNIRIDLLLDLKIHALPLLSTMVDYFFYMDRWNISYGTGYLIVSILAGLYWFWLEYLIQEGSMYPYPFLNVERNMRIMIFMVISLVAFGAFCLGKLVHPQFVPELKMAEKKAAKVSKKLN